MRANGKARRLHSPKAKQHPARLLCACVARCDISTLKQWSVESLTLRRPKTETEECKYPTALIDKERSSDNTV